MVVDVGTLLATATCTHCGQPIGLIRWTLDNTDRWLHDTTSDTHCPTSPVALPAPGTVHVENA